METEIIQHLECEVEGETTRHNSLICEFPWESFRLHFIWNHKSLAVGPKMTFAEKNIEDSN